MLGGLVNPIQDQPASKKSYQEFGRSHEHEGGPWPHGVEIISAALCEHDDPGASRQVGHTKNGPKNPPGGDVNGQHL